METDRQTVELVNADTIHSFAYAALLTVLLGASAYAAIPVPFSPVPVTLQVLMVFLAGLLLGPYWGGFSVALYLLAGALGAPVFSGGGAGLGWLFGPNGGYLWGFLLAAVIIGVLVHGPRWGTRENPSDKSLLVLGLSLLVGLTVIYALGVYWLAWVSEIGIAEAVLVGAAYFLPQDVVKVAVALAIVSSDDLALPRR